MLKVFGMARLTRDPEIRVTATDKKKVAKFGIAVKRRDGEADFYNVSVWGEKADFAEKYLQKGTKIVLSGRLTTSSYVPSGTDKKVTSVEIIAEDIEFAESKKVEADSSYEGLSGFASAEETFGGFGFLPSN